MKTIEVVGAKEHNLKNIDISFPINSITVVTGISGSGKSSLAFDTIYAEGQRRYVESLSIYARQFIKQFEKPKVKSITGVSPSIALEQRTSTLSPRSTVGTITEVYDYFRLLYSKLGIPKCPTHKTLLVPQTIENILESVIKIKGSIIISAPLVRRKKGEFKKEIDEWKRVGLVKAIIDGKVVDLENVTKLNKNILHWIDLIVDQVVIQDSKLDRIKNSIECALELTKGFLKVTTEKEKEIFFSQKGICPECSYNFAEILEPRLFSFNDLRGACDKCKGLGIIKKNETEKVCPKCKGERLKLDALSVFIKNLNIMEVSSLDLKELRKFVATLFLTKRELQVVGQIVKEILEKLDLLIDLGVGYLSLKRSTKTLSGGEAQRLKLGAALTNPLVGILYVLDEPSIGLHAKDHLSLIKKLKALRDRGNTILIVEHDKDTILHSDYIIDLGPGAGSLGGKLVYQGNIKNIETSTSSLSDYLKNKKTIFDNRSRDLLKVDWLKLFDVKNNNLKNIDIEIPLGTFVAVSGVSGSGKSSLVTGTLLNTLQSALSKDKKNIPLKIEGVCHLKRVIDINQKPIGNTPRSNPATYVNLMGAIRELFSKLPESRARGFKPGQFSFNLDRGRCFDCKGLGKKKIEFHFMKEIYVECETCEGARYNKETLSIKYKDKTIHDILSMTIEEAHAFFKNHSFISSKLSTLKKVGLSYVTLGQSSASLSGGEAQRIKLSKELSISNKNTLYILDEPTTGLHFEDIKKLIALLQELVEKGHTVICIEHNLDIIRSCDYIIDLGPSGGASGGKIVAKGHPQNLEVFGESATKKFLDQTRLK